MKQLLTLRLVAFACVCFALPSAWADEAGAPEKGVAPEKGGAPEQVVSPGPEATPTVKTPALAGVAIFVLPKNEASTAGAELLQDMLRTQLNTFARVEPRQLMAAARSVSSSVAPRVEAGFRALADKDHASALGHFTWAINTLKSHNGLVDKRLLARAFKGLGVSLVMSEDENGAKNAIAASLNLWPNQKGVEYAYTMKAFHLFGQLKKQRETEAHGTLEVTSATPGAVLILDGKREGELPQTLRSLPQGEHWMEVEAPGHLRLAQSITITGGPQQTVALTLTADGGMEGAALVVKSITQQRAKKKAAERLKTLSGSLGAEKVLVLVAGSRRNSFELRGWAFTPDGTRAIRQTVGDDLVAELAALLHERLALAPAPESLPSTLGGPPAASLVRVTQANGESTLAPQPDVEPEFYDTWWFWTATGGAVATTVAIVLAVVLGGEPEVPRGVLDITLRPVPTR